MRPLLLALLLAATPLFADEPVATILSYHEVVPGGVPPFKTHPPPGTPDVPTEADRYTLSLEKFIDQLDYLDAHGYKVIPLADLVDYIEGKNDDLPPRSVVITVDDGYLSAYKYLYPLLRERKLTATFFIYPQIINVGKNYLTWKQVREMADGGMDIESHTYTHPLLTRSKHPDMSDDDYSQFLRHELLDAKKEIEQHTGKAVRFIAFPYSNIDSEVENAAKNYGYDGGLYDRNAGELISRSSSALDLKRFPVEHDITMDQFARDLLPQRPQPEMPAPSQPF